LKKILRFRLRGTILTSVKTRLIASFLIVLLVPSFCIGFVSFQSSKQQIRDKMTISAQANVDLLNTTLDQYILSISKDAEFLASLLTSVSIDKKDPAVQKMIDGFMSKHPELEILTLGNENGAWMKSPDPGPQDYDPRKRDWYIATLKTPDKAVISKPYVSFTSKHTVITVSKTFPDSKGAVGLNLDLTKLGDIAGQAKVGSEGYVYVLDQDGQYLIHPSEKPGKKAAGAQYETMYQNKNGFVKYVKDGSPKEAYYTTNSMTGWKVVGTMTLSEYDKAAAPILHRTALVTAIALSAAAVLVFFMIRAIVVPLGRLRKGTEGIRNGDLTVRVQWKRKDEFGQWAAISTRWRSRCRALSKK
jgi:methyl-accepting chemotaxis protein